MLHLKKLNFVIQKFTPAITTVQYERPCNNREVNDSLDLEPYNVKAFFIFSHFGYENYHLLYNTSSLYNMN